MLGTWCRIALVTALLTAVTAHPAENDGFKALNVQVRPELSSVVYTAQLLCELDRPIGEALKLAELTIPARVGDRGQLELDLRNEGKFIEYLKDQTVTLSLKRDGVSQPLSVRIFLKKGAENKWTYRNVTQLSVCAGNDQLALVDANGNGIYNEAGIDGIALKDQSFIFPLPATDEQWCTLTQELTGLTLGPWGEDLKLNARPLTTQTPGALGVLKGVIEERLKLGLTPRPEDPKLSAELQKHCAYMAANNKLTHPEEKGKAGFSEEGDRAGKRSILSMGTSPEQVAIGMVQTYFHRIDVVRPDALAFGVGYHDRYGGIDGRTNLVRNKSANLWPVLCPAPGQGGIALTYAKEMPDATPGDNEAGYPITVQFNTRKLKLTSYNLRPVPPGTQPDAKLPDGASIPCYTFDPKTGEGANMTGFLKCVCIIPKDPLRGGTEYEVTMNVEVDGKLWTRTWRFTTQSGQSGIGVRRRR